MVMVLGDTHACQKQMMNQQNVMFDISDDMTKISELSRYNGKRKISRQTRLPREFYAGFDNFSILRNERKVN